MRSGMLLHGEPIQLLEYYHRHAEDFVVDSSSCFFNSLAVCYQTSPLPRVCFSIKHRLYQKSICPLHQGELRLQKLPISVPRQARWPHRSRITVYERQKSVPQGTLRPGSRPTQSLAVAACEFFISFHRLSRPQANKYAGQFISSRGNEYFCEIDEEYLTDRFNLTGLNTEVHYYQHALDLVNDAFDLDCDDEMREAIEKSARHLYGLVHARYIVTTRGLAKMVSATHRLT